MRLLLPLLPLLLTLSSVLAEQRPPNIILIMTDDQGYADLSCFGSKDIKTPHLDQAAKEGRIMTSYYSGNPVCSASRASLMTGCYSQRVLSQKTVLFPDDKIGLHPDEVTIADMLKTKGYATACVGKWHLGHHKPFLPTNQGFDSYYGIPYSNDMTHPGYGIPYSDKMTPPSDEQIKRPRYGQWDPHWQRGNTGAAWGAPLVENEEIIEFPVDQTTITRRYTDKSLTFIEENKDHPFFLYLAHSMPHVPLYVPDELFTEDATQAYTVTIQHIDAEVGRIIQKVKDLGIEQETYLLFTSDNGPWSKFEHHAGKAHPLSGSKGSTQEGGMRVPFVLWGPGRVPADTTSSDILCAADILPTIAALAGITPETRGEIDGLDASAYFHGTAPSPRQEMLYYGKQALCLRQGDWKYSIQGKEKKEKLYNLADDIAEKKNLAKEHPEKLAELASRFKQLSAQVTAGTRSMGEWTPEK